MAPPGGASNFSVGGDVAAPVQSPHTNNVIPAQEQDEPITSPPPQMSPAKPKKPKRMYIKNVNEMLKKFSRIIVLLTIWYTFKMYFK